MWVVWGRKREPLARPMLVTGRQEGDGGICFAHALLWVCTSPLASPFRCLLGEQPQRPPQEGSPCPLCLGPEHSLVWRLSLVPDSSSSSGKIVPHSGVNLRVKFTVDIAVLVKGVCPGAPGQTTGLPAPAPWGQVLTCSGTGVCVRGV